MTRIAALYDIHGNLPALDAVLRQVADANVDQVVVGGDVIPGPMPRECLERVLSLDVHAQFIHGNGERAVLEQIDKGETTLVPPTVREAIRWTATQVEPTFATALRAWPLTVRIVHPTHGDILFCHATPRNDTEIFTRRTAESVLLPIFNAAAAQIVVCGHTHMQFDRNVGDTRVINAGSIGMPFGEPGAYWLLITADDVELRRTPYDLVAASSQIAVTSYPGANDFAQKNVISPPSEEFILNAWAAAELR